MNPKEELINGVRELEPILQPYGFTFALETAALSSGGHSASGAFLDGNKGLELHFRYSLGLVSYQVGGIKIDHADFIAAQGGKGNYPGFSTKPVDAFRHLADDLKSYGGPFFNKDTTQFAEIANKLKKNPPVKGFKALSKNKT
jgi:hypothetical protein